MTRPYKTRYAFVTSKRDIVAEPPGQAIALESAQTHQRPPCPPNGCLHYRSDVNRPWQRTQATVQDHHVPEFSDAPNMGSSVLLRSNSPNQINMYSERLRKIKRLPDAQACGLQ